MTVISVFSIRIRIAALFLLGGPLLFAPLSALADITPFNQRLSVEGGAILLNVRDGDYSVSRSDIVDWVERSALAVSHYYGRFPVRRLRLEIGSEFGDDVGFGMAFGFDHHIEINLGSRATRAELQTDWVLVHEMLHMAHPDVGNRHKWFKEGLATYVEPIARGQVGHETPEQVWGGFVTQLPQGQPRRGDRGLDYTPTWGRTYWGGALFWFVCDVEIRKQTRNRKGLQDALRAILLAGGTLEKDWPIERALKIGDQATGTSVLRDTYNRMRADPAAVDLNEIWRELGVSHSLFGTLLLDDNAALADVRKAILSPPPTRSEYAASEP